MMASWWRRVFVQNFFFKFISLLLAVGLWLAGASTAELIGNPELTAEIQRAVDEANKAVSRAEAIRRFRVLSIDFTEAGGQLTPSLKLRRNVVAKECADDIEALYS